MLTNFFERLKENIVNIVTSRLTILFLLFLFLGGTLMYRLFHLQIVNGQEYLDNFLLQSKKTREIGSTRGNIYDRNGELLAYDELAYLVKIEDVYETTGRSKNKQLNANIYNLIKIIEKNGDEIISDFGIIIDEDGQYAFAATSETKRLRFLADIYGESYTKDLTEAERTSTPDEVMAYMAGSKRYAIGDYEEEGNSDSPFIPGKGYTKEEVLQMVTIRYAMSLTSFRKYVGTTVAIDINERTVAAVMENLDTLDGVSIEETTVRRYVDNIYFSHVIGYTGKITTEELESLNAQDLEAGGDGERYGINDIVGKSGIEAYMETSLQGRKGIETVYVNNTGKVMSIMEDESWDAEAGNNVYLTIDKELQIAAYNILEQKLAGILVSNIQNIKKIDEDEDYEKIPIPIYDVYYALFNNHVIDTDNFENAYAGENEQAVYAAFLEYKEDTYAKLREQLLTGTTPYRKLEKEYQVYQSNIVSYLYDKGIIDRSKVDTSDDTYIRWTIDETISIKEYLTYVISVGWVDVTKLNLDSKYSDSEAIYAQMVEAIFEILDYKDEFQTKLYKYMILKDKISGKQICKVLCEQGTIEIAEEDEIALYNDKISAYDFMINRISTLEITPAQLGLDPCTGSVVVTDVKTGDVLALVSYPGYDNNKMSNSSYLAQISVDKSEPQWNHATQQLSAPGSTFKMVSSTAALMEGLVTTKTKIECLGIYEAVTPSPRCWIYPRKHNKLDITGAIQHSCNYFFYDVGYRMSLVNGTYNAQVGLDTLAKYADMYGLTEKSGIEIAESSPQVSTEYPIQSAIGQGNNSFTTVGLARYVTTVANGGTCFELTLLDKLTTSDNRTIKTYEPTVRNTIEMPKSYWDAIHLGMRRVVERKSYFSDLAVNVAGKTGTAQENLSRADHALFVGYAPYENPEIAIATRIAFGYTSDYAAQTTRDIIKYYYGLAETEDLITGEADELDAAEFNND